jgi:hypothetical protein
MKIENLPEEFSQLSFSMSEFQIKNFVVNSQHTGYRQFKQVLLELEVRKSLEETMLLDRRKNLAEQKLYDEKIAAETSPAQIELYQIEKEKLQSSYENGLRAFERTHKEIEALEKIYNWFKQNYDIQQLLENQDKEEEDYWVRRLGTQAALEILTVGRIGVGNLEAMMQMGEDMLKRTLIEATKISRDIQEQVKYLDMVTDDDIARITNNEPKKIDL